MLNKRNLIPEQPIAPKQPKNIMQKYSLPLAISQIFPLRRFKSTSELIAMLKSGKTYTNAMRTFKGFSTFKLIKCDSEQLQVIPTRNYGRKAEAFLKRWTQGFMSQNKICWRCNHCERFCGYFRIYDVVVACLDVWLFGRDWRQQKDEQV